MMILLKYLKNNVLNIYYEKKMEKEENAQAKETAQKKQKINIFYI